MLRAGSHVSTRYGYSGAARHAAAIGGNAFQYFPKNPRTLKPKAFSVKDANACANWCKEHDMQSIAHGPYSVNPAIGGQSACPMIACTLNDLEIAEACGSIGVVVHFGHYKGEDVLQGYRNIIQWINSVAEQWQGQALILLENESGQRGEMGVTPEELMQIRTLVNCPEKIGFCLDTCHLYASGQWRPGQWSAFAARARKLGFWGHVQAIHMNDSMYPSGSRKDRHAAIGEGRIGEEDLKAMLATPELQGVPLILETPEGKGGAHREQLMKIRQLSGEVMV